MASDYHALLCTRISTVLHTFRSQLDSYTCFKYKITMKDRLNRLSVKIVVSSLRTGTRNPLFASVLFVDCEENFRFFCAYLDQLKYFMEGNEDEDKE